MSFSKERYPKPSLGLRLKRCAFRAMISPFWWVVFRRHIPEQTATRLAGLKPRLDMLKATAVLLGAEIINLSPPTDTNYRFSLWAVEYRDEVFHADSELDAIEWFLLHQGLHPDDNSG